MWQEGVQDPVVSTDLNTLLTALYVKIDEYLGARTRTGRPPKLSDAELLTLAVAQVLLGVRSEARWLRLVPRALPSAFPYLPVSPATTSACAPLCRYYAGSSGCWPPTPTCGPTQSGSWTPRRSSAPAPAPP